MRILQGLAGLFLLGGIISCFFGDFVIGAIIAFASFMAIGAIEEKMGTDKQKKLELALPKLDTERAELLQENFAKALADFNFIQQARDTIKDKELLAQLDKMQQIASNMLHYLQKQPEKILLARRFIDYYQDRAVLLVKKYIYLEETNLQAEEVLALKARMKQALGRFDEAYEEQFAKVMDEQIMDINAELDVMQQMFDDDGIKAKPQDSQTSSSAARAQAGAADGKGNQGSLPPFADKAKPFDDNATFEEFLRFSKPFMQQPAGKQQHGKGNLCRRSQGYMAAGAGPGRDKACQRKIIAALLAIFFGGFGAHKFYLRKNFWGVLYILFCWTGIPAIAGFIEGVRYLFMPTDDFYDQYLDKG